MPSPLELDATDARMSGLHSFFRFPGSFHPPLVRLLLRINEQAETIGDPMAGSGTVAIEAMALGRDVISMDIDPLSCLITRAKSSPIDPDEYELSVKQWLDLAGPLPTVALSDESNALEHLQQLENTPYSQPPNVFHWFEPHIVASLAKLLISLHDLGLSARLRTALEATFASIVRRVSKADPRPVSGLEVTKIMRQRLAKGIVFDIVTELKKRSRLLLEGYRHLLSLDILGKSRVIQGDVRNRWRWYCNKNHHKLDLIITSPPYCNAIEYWRRHRLEYFWLGLMNRDEILKKSRRFVGSTTVSVSDMGVTDEPKLKDIRSVIKKIEANGKIRKARMLRKYFLDTEMWVSSVLSTLSSTGKAYIVVGPSRANGTAVNTPKFVTDIIRLEGYRTKNFLRYAIKNQRMQYPTWNSARVKTETVIAVTR